MLCYDQDQTQQLPHASPPAVFLVFTSVKCLAFSSVPKKQGLVFTKEHWANGVAAFELRMVGSLRGWEGHVKPFPVCFFKELDEWAKSKLFNKGKAWGYSGGCVLSFLFPKTVRSPQIRTCPPCLTGSPRCFFQPFVYQTHSVLQITCALRVERKQLS